MTSINSAASNPVLPQTLTNQNQQLPMTALASPYDGTTPTTTGIVTPGTGYGIPTLTGQPNLYPGTGTGQSPQVNATNQTAIAPNGDVNQHVVNENQYTNRYYNIIVPNGALGGWGGLGSVLGSWNQPRQSFIDPQTGVMYMQKDTGITGWFRRLFGM